MFLDTTAAPTEHRASPRPYRGSGATLGARLRSRENELRILGLELGFVFLNEGADVICHLEQFLPLILV